MIASPATTLLIGLDVGSTTVKAVVVDKDPSPLSPRDSRVQP